MSSDAQETPKELAGVSSSSDTKKGQLIIVHFVERQLEGWTIDPKHWPLHVILVPWFRTDDEEAVLRSLDRLSGSVSAFTLKVGPEAKYGAKQNIAVNVIKNQNPVKDLHERMLAVLEQADIAAHESPYIGSQYTAHITQQDHGARHSNEGEQVIVNDFHIVLALSSSEYVVAQEFTLRH